MLTLSEMRSGNYVQTCDEQYGTIHTMEMNRVRLSFYGAMRDFMAHQLSPVPLTLKILPQAGFFLHEAIYEHLDTGVQLKQNSGHGFTLVHNGTEIVKINYVHELQNTFFQIMGYELVITLFGI
jgi:hypothetical protein